MHINTVNTSYLLKLLLPLKNWLVASLVGISSFFIPIQPLIIVTTTVALFDWAVKQYCLFMKDGGESIESGKMAATFYKVVLYGFFLGTLFIVDTMFIKTLAIDILGLVFDQTAVSAINKVPLTAIGTLMILTRETKSIDENWKDAFGYSPLDAIISKLPNIKIKLWK